jgi:iron-sulfur cluster repair protein YtfE (RIC family)
MTPEKPHTLAEINSVHRAFEEQFHRHQVALLESRPDEARALLEAFKRNLLCHMQEEADILLPLYRERAAPLRGGDPEILLGEHKKILEWLHRLDLRLQRLGSRAPDPKAVIALLDDEAYFKKSLEHHTLREERIFYPELERVATDREKAGLLRLLTFSFDTPEASDPGA